MKTPLLLLLPPLLLAGCARPTKAEPSPPGTVSEATGKPRRAPAPPVQDPAGEPDPGDWAPAPGEVRPDSTVPLWAQRFRKAARCIGKGTRELVAELGTPMSASDTQYRYDNGFSVYIEDHKVRSVVLLYRGSAGETVKRVWDYVGADPKGPERVFFQPAEMYRFWSGHDAVPPSGTAFVDDVTAPYGEGGAQIAVGMLFYRQPAAKASRTIDPDTNRIGLGPYTLNPDFRWEEGTLPTVDYLNVAAFVPADPDKRGDLQMVRLR